jgi:hypothetical protein
MALGLAVISWNHIISNKIKIDKLDFKKFECLHASKELEVWLKQP